MLPLLIPLAFAAPSETCASGDTFEATVARAEAYTTGPVTIYVDPECDVGAAVASFQPGSDSQLEFVVSGTGSERVEVPPIIVGDGVSLTLENVYVMRSYVNPDLPSSLTDLLGGAGVGIEIQAFAATLDLEGVDLQGDGGTGLVLGNGDLTGNELTATDFDAHRAFYAIAYGEDTSVDLTDARFESNDAGGMAVVAYSGTPAVQLHTPYFHENEGAGADVAMNGGTLTIDGGQFAKSYGADGGAGNGAPIYIGGGSFSCQDCTFSGGSGDTASVLAGVLGSDDQVVLDGGTVEPAYANQTSFHVEGGGTVYVSGTTFTGAGEVARYDGTTVFEGATFLGYGGSTAREVLHLESTSAQFDDSTMCGYGSNGFGLIGAYDAEVGIAGSVFQSLALATAPVVKAWSVDAGGSQLDVRDNTLVDSDATFVGGSPASLSFTNNLVAAAHDGVFLDTWPDTVELDYNLWYGNEANVYGRSEGAHDLVEVDPLFASTYSASDCTAPPRLQDASPANGAGDPSRTDTFGNTPSDIGAFDISATPGDPGDDTGADETGVVDSGAVDTAAGDTDGGDGVPRLIGGALPPCGCATTGPSFTWLAPLLVLARRRRR